MIPESMLGSYEYIDRAINADKFWACTATPWVRGVPPASSEQYEIRWGRRGTAGQGPQRVSAAEALRRINEKVREGYRHAMDHDQAVAEIERIALQKFQEKITQKRTKKAGKALASETLESTPTPAVRSRARL